MTLHLFSNTEAKQLTECLTHCTETDAIVLMNETALEGLQANLTMQQTPKVKTYLLTQENRPEAKHQPSDSIIRKINMTELVELTTEHNPILSW